MFLTAAQWLYQSLAGPAQAGPQTPDRSGVVTRVESAANALRRELDLAYAPIEYVLWCLPSLGFLGTVLGISDAMLGSDRLLAGQKEQQIAAIQVVTLQLAYAFDTTWVALLLGIFVMLMMR